MAALVLSLSVLLYCFWTLICLERNVRKARSMGVPVVRVPFSADSYIWVILQPLVWASLAFCATSKEWGSYPDFIRFSHRNWHFLEKDCPNVRFGSAWAIASPGGVSLHVADAKGSVEVFSRWKDFVRPTYKYTTAVHESSSSNDGDAQVGSREKTTAAYRDTLHVVLDNAILLMLVPYRYLNKPLMPRGLARVGRAASSFKSMMMEMIAEETAALVHDAVTRNGLLSPLVRAATRQPTAPDQHDNTDSNSSRDKKGGLSAEEILGDVFTINFAGHDTVLIALTFALTLLAAHPRVQAWVHEEIVMVLGERDNTQRDDDGDMDWDYKTMFPRLRRCQAVLLETLRLYAPITGVPKVRAHSAQGTSLVIEDRLIPIPAGTEIFPALLGMQTDARHWSPQPHEWRPSRWIIHPLPGMAATREEEEEQLLEPLRGTFFPWSDGPMNCVGKKFSMVESVAVLARLLHRHVLQVEREDESETEAQMRRRVQDCVNDVNFNVLLRMTHPERIRLRCLRRD
ncbi:cytochrome P450 [Apiospora sp. TS-2023a]